MEKELETLQTCIIHNGCNDEHEECEVHIREINIREKQEETLWK